MSEIVQRQGTVISAAYSVHRWERSTAIAGHCFRDLLHLVAVRRPTSLPLMRVFAALSLAVCKKCPRGWAFLSGRDERWGAMAAPEPPEALHETAYTVSIA